MRCFYRMTMFVFMVVMLSSVCGAWVSWLRSSARLMRLVRRCCAALGCCLVTGSSSVGDHHCGDAVVGECERECVVVVVVVVVDLHVDAYFVVGVLDVGCFDVGVDVDVLMCVPVGDRFVAGERAVSVVDRCAFGECVEERFAVVLVGRVEELVDGGFELGYGPIMVLTSEGACWGAFWYCYHLWVFIGSVLLQVGAEVFEKDGDDVCDQC